jgi:hypothetical protein
MKNFKLLIVLLLLITIKINAQTIEWAARYGDINEDGYSKIVVDRNDNVYTTGLFVGTNDFDPGSGIFNLTSHGGGYDIFISKFDKNGNFCWVKNIGSAVCSQLNPQIAVDLNNNLYLTGYLMGTVDLDPGLGVFNLSSTGGTSDIFICKLDSNGNFLWAKQISDGESYAITIDSDGQHSASEIPEFIKTCNNHKDALIIGARTTINGNVPRKNSFANKFSNFWVFIITGIKLIDTQSGFRLYPLNKMQNIKFVSRRYEFELEVLAKASWRNIPIISIPISVFYPPNNERITHFRPFIDFLRISLLNSWLVFLGLAIYRPLNITKSLFRKFKKLF